MKPTLLFACAIAFCWTLPAVAAQNLKVAEGRAAYAGELENGFRTIRNKIPALTPAESEALAKESAEALPNGQITARYMMLTQKREWLTSQVSEGLTNLVKLLGELKTKKLGRPVETFYWTHITNQIINYTFWSQLYQLSAVGVISKDDLAFVGLTDNLEHLHAGATQVASTILVEILIPNVTPAEAKK